MLARTRSTRFRMVLSAILLTSVLSVLAHAQSVVCRAHAIAGFEGEYQVAKSLVGANTSVEGQIRLYISYQGEELYVQSNFVTAGYEWPTKIATSEQIDLETILLNIIGDPDKPSSDLKLLLANHIQVIMDPQVFTEPREAVLRISNVRNIMVATPVGARPVRFVKGSLGNKVRLVATEIGSHIFARVDDLVAIDAFREGSQRVLDPKKLRILSLVDNTDINRSIESNVHDRHIPFDFSSRESLAVALDGAKGTVVLCVGHVEDGDFVSSNRSGAFRISITDLESVCARSGVAPVIIGCGVIDSASGVASVRETLHSSQILPQIFRAMNARTIGEYYDALAGGGVGIVVDSLNISQARKAADIVRVPNSEGGPGRQSGSGVRADGIRVIGTYVEIVPLAVALAATAAQEAADERERNAERDGGSGKKRPIVVNNDVKASILIGGGVILGGMALWLVGRRMWRKP